MPIRVWMLLPATLILAAIGLIACSGSEGAEVDAGSRLAVVRGDLTTRMLLTGELVAEEAESLVVPNANIWPVQIRWLAEDGIEVQAGEKLVEFDNSQLTSSLEEMRTQETEAANRLDSLRAQAASEEASTGFELARKRAALEKARLEAGIPAGVLAERAYRQRQLELHKAELELAAAESKLKATRQAKTAEIEIQRIALQKTRGDVASSEARIELLALTASRAGILLLENNRREDRPFQAGDSTYPGSVVGRLPDLSTMIVAANLFDVDDGRVAAGMPVVATLDAFPELAFGGRIRDVDTIADQAGSRSRRRFFRVRIDLDRLDLERMRPGMSVKVLIEHTDQDSLLVPRRSLEVSQSTPRALLADGTWVPVSLGACDAVTCVAESGLEDGVELGRAATGPEAVGEIPVSRRRAGGAG